jgi:GNAT superfamily N-acetyltransferase
LYVSPSGRGTGVGRALAGAIIAEASRWGTEGGYHKLSSGPNKNGMASTIRISKGCGKRNADVSN